MVVTQDALPSSNTTELAVATSPDTSPVFAPLSEVIDDPHDQAVVTEQGKDLNWKFL